jgi:hypothetical protein
MGMVPNLRVELSTEAAAVFTGIGTGALDLQAAVMSTSVWNRRAAHQR